MSEHKNPKNPKNRRRKKNIKSHSLCVLGFYKAAPQDSKSVVRKEEQLHVVIYDNMQSNVDLSQGRLLEALNLTDLRIILRLLKENEHDFKQKHHLIFRIEFVMNRLGFIVPHLPDSTDPTDRRLGTIAV